MNPIRLTSLDVGGEVDLVGQLGDVDLEAVLDLVQDLGVGLVGDEGHGETLEKEGMKCQGQDMIKEYFGY